VMAAWMGEQKAAWSAERMAACWDRRWAARSVALKVGEMADERGLLMVDSTADGTVASTAGSSVASMDDMSAVHWAVALAGMTAAMMAVALVATKVVRTGRWVTALA
jgi:hypothetical protein